MCHCCLHVKGGLPCLLRRAFALDARDIDRTDSRVFKLPFVSGDCWIIQLVQGNLL
jgi:hypothetical protein